MGSLRKDDRAVDVTDLGLVGDHVAEGPAVGSESRYVVSRSTVDEVDLPHILLVDDVFTTGSTLTACFTALRSVFPPSVRISVATLGFVGEV